MNTKDKVNQWIPKI